MSELRRNESAESNFCLLDDNLPINQSNLIKNNNQVNKNPNSNEKENNFQFVCFINGIYENNCFIIITIHFIYHCE